MWRVGTVYVRTLAYPLRFITYLRNQGNVCFTCTRASVSVKENIRIKVRTRDQDDVNCEGVTY